MDNIKQILLYILNKLGKHYTAFAQQTLTITNSSQSLTVPEGTKYILCQVESTVTDGKAIRYFYHGLAPTTTTGLFRGNGDAFDLENLENIKNLKVIEGTSGTTKLIVIYHK